MHGDIRHDYLWLEVCQTMYGFLRLPLHGQLRLGENTLDLFLNRRRL
jgi:hypothetical protein